MSDSIEELHQQLQAAQRALAEAQARCECHDAEHQAVTKEQEDNRSALLFMLEDLEAARKKIEAAHREWVAALDVVNDPIFLHDKQFRILRCNKAYQQRAGIPFHELIGQPYYKVFPKNHAPLPCCLRAMEKTEEEEEEEEEVTVGEVTYRSRAFSIHDEQGGYLYSVHTLEDITEHKHMAAEVIESEEKFRKISESAQDAIIMMGPDQRISFWNGAAEHIFGYTAAEALGQELHGLIVPEPARALFKQAFPHFLATGEGAVIGKRIEVSALHRGGLEFPVELSISATQLNEQWHAIAMVRDISERKRAEHRLRESQKLTQDIIDGGASLIYSLDREGRFTLANKSLLALFKIAPDQLLGHSREAIMSKEIAEAHRNNDLAVINEKAAIEFEERNLQADGEHVYWSQKFPLFDSAGNVTGVCGISTDITARKRAELAIAHANRALSALSEVNRSLVYASDEIQLLQNICRAIVEHRGYLLAWVGYVQHDEEKSVKVMAHAGHDEGYLDTMQLTWAEAERGMGPSGSAIRSGATQICQDLASDPLFLPWREVARQQGYAADLALPLLDNDNAVFGVLNVYAGEVNAFTSAEISLLEQMARDLAFGVLTLHTRHERDLALVKNQEQLVQLQDSLEDTVRAMAGLVEMRDPYTAGHQARVADLAVAIARKMGLPEEQVHAIHLAGVVHDLGKIQIPAEILSKPGKISDLEFSFIKTHAQAGYDILKGIDFPWPIAQMVLQHHERLDGSGYPQGLKGEAILLEARILSVADVVEAIYSHRPYRPGLGIDTALGEITGARGTHYDPQVVDACVALIREQGYVFPG